VAFEKDLIVEQGKEGLEMILVLQIAHVYFLEQAAPSRLDPPRLRASATSGQVRPGAAFPRGTHALQANMWRARSLAVTDRFDEGKKNPVQLLIG
jgi:hypothetical protein